MEKFHELLKKLNKLDSFQKYRDWQENIPEHIWNDYFNDGFEVIKFNLDVDTHRWYETSITVIKILDGLLGIRHITNIFSEASSVEDCYVKLQFFEMEEFSTISYKIKK